MMIMFCLSVRDDQTLFCHVFLWHCSSPQTPSALPGTGLLPAESVCLCAVPGQPEGMMVGCKGSVTLDARFDAGYFCTVKVGRLEFKGML